MADAHIAGAKSELMKFGTLSLCRSSVRAAAEAGVDCSGKGRSCYKIIPDYRHHRDYRTENNEYYRTARDAG